MLDIKLIRENPEFVKQAVAKKNSTVDIDKLIACDETRRKLIAQEETLRAKRNEASKQIGILKKEKKPCGHIMEQVRIIGNEIKQLDEQIRSCTSKIDELIVWIPNIPHESSPIGDSENSNLFVREWGDKPSFNFEPKDHVAIGEGLDILDINRATKLSGAGFTLMKGAGALLERALINFMIDIHTREHGYTEISPPFVVMSACMFGTGQLPKMEEDMYKVKDEDLYLIPTAEVPVTNIHRGEILNEDDLPRKFVAYTPCFRREAGSYGKDTRGMIRIHQFDKVELVKLVKPDTSYDELESLLKNAEKILQLLDLPYRVVQLCTGDLSFSASKCYDIEAWAPGLNRYLEVSSCSTFEDFQARRMNIRYRDTKTGKPVFVHTLNGSGVALPRVVISIIENYQTANSQIIVPKVLRPYMNGMEII